MIDAMTPRPYGLIMFLWGLLATVLTFVMILSPAHAETDQHKLKVRVMTPNGSMVVKPYDFLQRAEKPWNICVSFPHLKDSYWLATNYGVADQAKRLKVGMQLHHAGGYNNLSVQIQQIEDCVADGADGVIIAAISHSGLNPLITDLAQRGIPVIDLVNGIASSQVKARSKVSYYDMGLAIGRYIASKFSVWSDDATEPELGWFPGPKDAGWVHDGSRGFFRGLADNRVMVVTSKHGDTGRHTQTRLITAALDTYPKISILAGNAVSAEAAIHVARKRQLSRDISIFAYYFTPGIYRGIKRGQIKAAPTDSPVVQARIAMDQMVRILEGKPYEKHVSPIIRLIDRNNIQTFDHSTTLAPSGFRPTFSVNRVAK